MVAEHPSDIRRLVFAEASIPDDGLYQAPGFTPQEGSPVFTLVSFQPAIFLLNS